MLKLFFNNIIFLKNLILVLKDLIIINKIFDVNFVYSKVIKVKILTRLFILLLLKLIPKYNIE